MFGSFGVLMLIQFSLVLLRVQHQITCNFQGVVIVRMNHLSIFDSLSMKNAFLQLSGFNCLKSNHYFVYYHVFSINIASDEVCRSLSLTKQF